MLNRSKYLSTSYKDPHQKQNMSVLTKITPPCQEKEGKFMLPAYRLCLVWEEWVPRISTFCGNPTWGKETRRWSTNLCDMMSFYLPVCCMTRLWICLNLCLPHKYTSQEQSVLPCFTCFLWKRTWSNKKNLTKRLESRERKAKPFPRLGVSVHEYLNIYSTDEYE